MKHRMVDLHLFHVLCNTYNRWKVIHETLFGGLAIIRFLLYFFRYKGNNGNRCLLNVLAFFSIKIIFAFLHSF